MSGTVQALSGQTQGLQSQITTINSKTGVFITTAQTGQFYAANNPDGFITAAQVSGTGVTYVGGLTASVGVVGGGNVSISTGTPNNLIISGATGAFASNVNLQTVSGSVAAINAKTGTFITSAQTGRFVDTGSNQTISGIKTFRGGVYTYGNVDIRDSNSLTTAQLNWRALYDKSENLSLDWGERILSGVWSGQDLIVSGYPVLTKNQTGLFLTTGAGDARYIQYSETGAFASNVNLQTISGRVSSVSGTTQALSGQTQGLQGQINTITTKTGAFLTTGAGDSRYVQDTETGDFVTTGDTRWLSFSNISQTLTSMIGGSQIVCYPNVASWSRTNVDGALVLNTPLPRNENRMFWINIRGYNYGDTQLYNTWIGGYVRTYSSGSIDGLPGSVYKTKWSCIDIGNDSVSKYLGINKSGYLAVALGETGSSFSHTHLVADVWVAFSQPAVVPSGWSWSVETGENLEFLDIVTVNNGGASFYSSTNPSGYINFASGDTRYVQYSETGAFASNVNLQTISGIFTGQTQGLQGQINTINAKTGVFITSAQTGQFYPSSNPSGFITAAQAGGVQSLTVTGREISGVITISSSGGVNLTSAGQTITINVSTGQFASAVNLITISGRVNSVSGTTQALSGQTQGLQTQITAINTKTGAFITTGAGDSRYIQYSETGAFASNVNLQTVSGTTQGLQSQILALSGVTVFTTGDQIITGEKTFFVVHISGQNSRLTFGSGISGSTIQDTSNSLSISGPSANVGISEGNDLIFLGDGQTLGASGAGLLNVGFSGNTVNLNVSGVNYIFPVSTTGIFVSTGAGDIRYILRNESGQFASVVNLNSTGLILSGIDVGIQNQINTINAKTGAFLTSGAGDARYIQYTETGAFASNVNLQTVSGRVSAVSGALSGQTQGLQSQINTLNNKTGVFITDAETGDFVTTDDSRWLSFGNVSQTITSMIGGNQIICYPNVASWSRTTTNGALVFNTPLSRTNNRMFCINIKGYNYGTRKIHNILLGGYIYTSISGSIDGLPGAIFKAAVSCLDMGNDGLQKCVGINKSGYLAISLGTTGSTFTYTHLTADVWASFNSPSVLKSKWSWSVETGENFEFLDIATGTTGQNFFYPSSNPSGYISFESGDTRYLQYIETGQFASSVNLSTISGRVDSVSGSAQALSGQTQGLQSQINTINAKTGTFITTAQTGSFGGAITWRVVTGLITGLASGDYVKIPSGKLYTPGAEELSIFVNGDLQYITDEYIEIDTSGISFLYNVPMDSKIIFNFIG